MVVVFCGVLYIETLCHCRTEKGTHYPSAVRDIYPYRANGGQRNVYGSPPVIGLGVLPDVLPRYDQGALDSVGNIRHSKSRSYLVAGQRVPYSSLYHVLGLMHLFPELWLGLGKYGHHVYRMSNDRYDKLAIYVPPE